MSELNIKEMKEALSLPDHLRLTWMNLKRLGVASAQQIAELTGKSRALESDYLNQLCKMRKIHKNYCHNARTFEPGATTRVFFSTYAISNSIRELPSDVQRAFFEDIHCAIQNRLSVLRRAIH